MLVFSSVSVFGAVYINEFSVDHETDDDWIEIYSDIGKANLNGWTLQDSSSRNPIMHTFTTESLDPNGHVVVEVGSKLAKTGDAIYLVNRNGVERDSVRYGSNSNDTAFQVDTPGTGQSAGRLHDGIDEWVVFDEDTQGAMNNREPAGIIPTQELREGVSEEIILDLSALITDSDADPLDFTLDPASLDASNPLLCELSEPSPGEFSLKITPRNGDATFRFHNQGECILNIDDGFTQVQKNILVDLIPALEIIEDSFSVQVNRQVSEDLSAAPGDEIEINFNYRNNIDGVLFGYTTIKVMDSPGTPALFETQDITLFPKEENPSGAIVFPIRDDISGPYSVVVSVSGQSEIGPKTASKVLVFNVQQKVKSARIADLRVQDSQLSCTTHARLIVDVANMGSSSFVPELRISDAPATGVDEELDLVGGNQIHKVTGDAIAVGEVGRIAFNLDMSSYAGDQTLYVYLVSPFFFDGTDLVFGDEAFVDVTVENNCLNTDLIEQQFVFYLEDGRKVIDLLEQDADGNQININEDKTNGLAFEIVDETDTNVVDCSFHSTLLDRIRCDPKQSGTSDVTVEVTKGPSVVQETFTVTVLNSFGFAPVFEPTSDVVLRPGNATTFNVSSSDASFDQSKLEWKLDGDLIDQGDVTDKSAFTFEAGFDATVSTLEVFYDGELMNTWTITVDNKPTDLAAWGLSASDVPDNGVMVNPTLQNSFGTIEFTGNVDVSDIMQIGDVVELTSKRAGVKSNSPFNRPATITLAGIEQGNTIMKRASSFKESDPTFVTCTTCTQVSHTGTDFVFDVTGFSTYTVVTEQPADLDVSLSAIPTGFGGQDVSFTLTVQNTGTSDPLTGVSIDVTGLDATFSPVVATDLDDSTLDAGETDTATITVSIPEDESAGDKALGDIVVTSSNGDMPVSVTVTVNSLLSIENFEVNGKSSGDFDLDGSNDIEFEVRNDYTEDMEVDVEVTIDLGDDEIDEDDDDDINAEDDQKFSFDVDLRNEDVEDDLITVEIRVEAEADDGERFTVTESFDVDLDIEKHDVVITDVTVNPTVTRCDAQSTIAVSIENQGSEDEDDVEIRVFNGELGLDERHSEIELDEFFDDRDNDFRTNFVVPATDRDGTYSIDVEVFRDGKREDSSKGTLRVEGCVVTQTATQPQVQYVDNVGLLRAYEPVVVDTTAYEVEEDEVFASTSFRDSDGYVLAMGVLVFLIVIAVILAVAVASMKPRRRRRY